MPDTNVNDETPARSPHTHTGSGTPVLIIGAGPAGLTAALSLARLGVRSTVITRYPYTAHTPRAHVVNQRTMEIFRQLGIEDRVRAQSDPQSFMEVNAWVTSMAGIEIGRFSAWGAGDADHSRYALASPSSMCNLPQHLLEPLLVEAVQSTNMVDLRFGHEFLTMTEDSDGVTAQIRVRETERTYTLRAPYLVGADGARSRVLEQAGLHVVGPENLGEFAFVWFEADLTRFVAHRPGILFHPIVPDGRPGLIMVRPWNEWIAGVALNGSDDEDWENHESIVARIRPTIGDPTVSVRIKNVARWTMRAQYAPQYSRGRVFCMGDAVHRHTPFNGLGLNTSIGDAHNLAWKLAMVLKGDASPTLLDTYSAERAPQGQRIVERATATGMAMLEIPPSLGLQPGMTEGEVYDQIHAVEENSARGNAARQSFQKQLDAIAGPGYNALGVEVGYRYRAGAVVADGTAEPTVQDPDTDYLPTTWPGARLPHVWLEIARRRVSSLDLIGTGCFTLLTGARAGDWADAATEATQATGALVQVVEIGGLTGVLDPARQWAAAREVGETGAVLVRPDGHVAWRALDSSNTAALIDVLATVTGRSLPTDHSIH